MLTWYVADLKTGKFVEEFPFKTSGIERTVSQRSTCSVTLDVVDPSTPPSWQQIIDGRRALIVPVDDGTPLCGFTVEQITGIGTPTIGLTLVSLEGLPDSVYVTDLEFTEGDTDESEVARQLLTAKFTTGWGFTLNVTATGRSGDHVYSQFEDRTVLSALNDLAAQEGGPEWVTRIQWENSTHQRFTKSIEIGPQVGRVNTSVILEDHHLQVRTRDRSWNRRAVSTIATGDGSGDSRPMSSPVIDREAIAAGVPPWEMRVAATSIESEDGLDRFAQSAAAKWRYGTSAWSLEVNQMVTGAPRVAHDYDIGDVVTLDLRANEFDTTEYSGPARLVGWKASVMDGRLTTVTPVFWTPDDENI